MKAIVRERFGSPDVLQLKEIEKPAPNDSRGVLVKVYASSVNPADRYDVNGMSLALRLVLPLFRMGVGVRRPKEPQVGTDLAGTVEAVSSNVTQFKPGDEVYGVGFHGYAEYAVARENRVALKPKNRSFEESAAVPIAGFTALQALRNHGHIEPGKKVLINGAGGGVGTFAVQIAKSFGAEVTAVTNTQNLDMVRSLGADHVIDYTKEDFTKNEQRYDLICDIASAHSPSSYKRIMNPNGICVIVGFRDKVINRLIYFVIRKRFSTGDKKFKFFVAKSNQEDLDFMKELMEAGKITPVIDRRYQLSETPQAIKYLGEGKARGKIVITVADDQQPSRGPSRKEAWQ
ncbi:NAD(P)-dependent alcohol dehydrogenase [Candidatus Bathyarchaeota archaeon]|nr:MAG: NAD(P)-dependent alcohol dehydrogenase [Candidatus Bathyarchaeota archaeon]TMI56758.1 MAG: NAD(P)-dependent alcohol dehydrogenase [Candidatus Bathyarchaeota archaeon]